MLGEGFLNTRVSRLLPLAEEWRGGGRERGYWRRIQEELKPSCDSGPGSLQNPDWRERAALGRRRYQVGLWGWAPETAHVP